MLEPQKMNENEYECDSENSIGIRFRVADTFLIRVRTMAGFSKLTSRVHRVQDSGIVLLA